MLCPVAFNSLLQNSLGKASSASCLLVTADEPETGDHFLTFLAGSWNKMLRRVSGTRQEEERLICLRCLNQGGRDRRDIYNAKEIERFM